MPKKITSLKVYDPAGYGVTGGDEVQDSNGSNELLYELKSYPLIERRRQKVEKMTFDVHAGSEWSYKRLLAFRCRLVVTYDDGSREMYRVQQLTGEANGSSPLKVEAWGILYDLTGTYLAYRRTEDVSYNLPLTGFTLNNVLTNVVFNTEYGIPSFFNLNNVDASVSSLEVNVAAGISSHLDVIYAICDSADAEFSVTYDYANNQLDFDFDDVVGGGVSGATTRVIHSTDLQANRDKMTVKDDYSNFFSRIIPRFGDRDSSSGLELGVFPIQSATEITPTSWDLELPAGVLYADDMFDSGSFYVRTDNATISQAVQSVKAFPVVSVDSANNLLRVSTLSTDAPSTITPDDNELYFYVLETGASTLTRLSYLPLGGVEGDGVVAKPVFYADIPVYANLFEDAGGSGDMSSFTGSLPDGTNLITTSATAVVKTITVSTDTVVVEGDVTDFLGDTDTFDIVNVGDGHNGTQTITGTPTYDSGSDETTIVTTGVTGVDDVTAGSGGWIAFDATATTSESTDAYRVVYGTKSVKVVCPYAGLGIETDLFATGPTYDGWSPVKGGYMSAWSSASVESGTMRMEIVTSTGTVYPTGERMESSEDVTRGMAIEGAPRAASVKVRWTATEDNTTFYVDALSFTRSSSAYQYQADMGASAMWVRAAAELVDKGGYQTPTLNATFYDLATLSGGSWDEVTVGDYVTIKDYPDSGGHLIDVVARVEVLRDVEDRVHGRLIKQVQFVRESNSLSNTLGSSSRAQNTSVASIDTQMVAISIPNISAQATYLFADQYGIVADYNTSTDSGTDNSPALGRLIQMAESSGATIILPPGDILLSSRININNQKPFILRGAGMWKTRIYPRFTASSLTPVFNLNGVYGSTDPNQVELRDFSIYGGVDTADDENLLGIYINYGSHFVDCQNVAVRGLYRGWQLANCWNMDFYGCEATNCLENGWHVGFERDDTPATCNALRWHGGRGAGNTLHGFYSQAGANLMLNMDLEGNKGCNLYARFPLGMSVVSTYSESNSGSSGTFSPHSASSVSYVRGDRVYITNDNRDFTYVCKLDHTSDSASAPNSGGSYETYWDKCAGYRFLAGRDVAIVGTTHNVWVDRQVHFWFESTQAAMTGSGVSSGTAVGSAQLGTFLYAESNSMIALSAPDFRAITHGIVLDSSARVDVTAPYVQNVDYPIVAKDLASVSVQLHSVPQDLYDRSDFGWGRKQVTAVSDNGSTQCRHDCASHGLSDGDEVYIRSSVNGEGKYSVTVIDVDRFDTVDLAYTGDDSFYITAPELGSYTYRSAETLTGERRVKNSVYKSETQVESLLASTSIDLKGSPAAQGEYSTVAIRQNNDGGTWTTGPQIVPIQTGADGDQQGWAILVHSSSTFSDSPDLALIVDHNGRLNLEQTLRLAHNPTTTGVANYTTLYADAAGEVYMRIGTGSAVKIGSSTGVGDVTAANSLTTAKVVVGDDGAKGIETATAASSTSDLKDVLVSLGLLTDGGATPVDLDGGNITSGNIDSETGTFVLRGNGSGDGTVIGYISQQNSAASRAYDDTSRLEFVQIGGDADLIGIDFWTRNSGTFADPAIKSLRLQASGGAVFYYKILAQGDIEIDGSLNHDGATIGFNGATPTAQGSAIADVSGGSTVDSEARSAINALLAYLRTRGDIAT